MTCTRLMRFFSCSAFVATLGLLSLGCSAILDFDALKEKGKEDTGPGDGLMDGITVEASTDIAPGEAVTQEVGMPEVGMPEASMPEASMPEAGVDQEVHDTTPTPDLPPDMPPVPDLPPDMPPVPDISPDLPPVPDLPPDMAPDLVPAQE